MEPDTVFDELLKAIHAIAAYTFLKVVRGCVGNKVVDCLLEVVIDRF